MTDFLRFRTPAYTLDSGESFPGTIGRSTYALINVTSGGTGAGGSAPVDGASISEFNSGTRFVGFREDADAKVVNRGLAALATNSDLVDDVLRTSLPRSAYVDVTLSGPDMYLVLPPTTFAYVGEYLSVTTPVTSLMSVCRVVGGSELFAATNDSRVAAPLLIINSSGTSLVGTAVDGFASGVRVRLNGTVPAGTYRVYYGARSSYANIPEAHIGGLFAPVQALRSQVVPLSGVYTQGLDDKYRRSSNPVSSNTLDTPGAGASIVRDGTALTVLEEATGIDYDARDCSDFGASFLAVKRDNGHTYLTPGLAGWSGFVGVSGYVDEASSGLDWGPAGRIGSFFSSWVRRDFRTPSSNLRTYLPAGVSAVGNPSGGGGYTISVAAPYYFRNGGSTAIRPDYDFLQVEYADGTKHMFRVVSFVTDRVLSVYGMGEQAATRFTANQPLKITLCQRVYNSGDQFTQLTAPADAFVSQEFPLPANRNGLLRILTSGAYPSVAALTWGGFNADGSVGTLSKLAGDGSASVTDLRVSGIAYLNGVSLNSISAQSLEVDTAATIAELEVAGSITSGANVSAHSITTTGTVQAEGAWVGSGAPVGTTLHGVLGADHELVSKDLVSGVRFVAATSVTAASFLASAGVSVSDPTSGEAASITGDGFGYFTRGLRVGRDALVPDTGGLDVVGNSRVHGNLYVSDTAKRIVANSIVVGSDLSSGVGAGNLYVGNVLMLGKRRANNLMPFGWLEVTLKRTGSNTVVMYRTIGSLAVAEELLDTGSYLTVYDPTSHSIPFTCTCITKVNVGSSIPSPQLDAAFLGVVPYLSYNAIRLQLIDSTTRGAFSWLDARFNAEGNLTVTLMCAVFGIEGT